MRLLFNIFCADIYPLTLHDYNSLSIVSAIVEICIDCLNGFNARHVGMD